MTLLEVITEMHALFPGKYVSVDVAVGWHVYDDSTPEVTVNCYVEGIGHLAWNVPSIDAAMTIVRARKAGTGNELAISDANIGVKES